MTIIKLKDKKDKRLGFYKIGQWFKDNQEAIFVLTQVGSEVYKLIGISGQDSNRQDDDNLFNSKSRIYGVNKSHSIFTNLTPIDVTISEN